MASSTRAAGSALRQLIVVVVLLLLLVGMAVAYYLMTRPPELSGQGERDRKFLFSIYGFEGDLLRRPTGVGFDDDGNIFVADTGKKRIVVFDGDGNFLRVYGEAGKEEKKLWNPIDVAITPDGRSFVVDKSQKKLVEFDASGRAVRDITIEEAPTSVEISDDLMYVTTDSGVLIANLRGELQTGYIKRGKEAGSFDRPGGVAVDENGTLYVADSLNYRVQAISTKGEPLWQYGEPVPADKAVQFQSEDRKFGLPSSIAVDENGLIYVVDGMNHEVEVLDTEGNSIEVIGDTGHGDGAFYYPDGIDYHNGRIAIADKFNDRIEVFSTPLPPSQQWRAFVPYALALLLLPLLLLPFVMRRNRYVITPEVADLIVADDDRDVVVDSVKQVHVTPKLAEWGENHSDIKLKWIKHDPDADVVQAIVSKYGVAVQDAEALAVAASIRGKRVLIGDGQALRAAAAGLDVPLVRYDEVKQALRDQKAKKKPAVPAEEGAE